MWPVLMLVQEAKAAAPTASDAGTSLFDLPALVKRVIDWAVGFAPNLVGAVLTLVVGVWVAKLVTRGLRSLMVRAKADESLSHFLSGLAYYGLLALVLIAVAGKLGVETTSFVALLGAVGLAVGFALQGSLGNLAAGVMILFFRPFHVNDSVEVAGQAGVVKEIGVFATILVTADNRKVIVPNSAITGASIVNSTAYETRRVDLAFPIAGDEDLARARAVLLAAIESEPRVLREPPPEVAAVVLADGLNLKLMAWVATKDYAALQSELLERAKAALVSEGVRGPVPQREIKMVGQPGA
jgi:small conductance mechanosensitive channel